MQLLMYSSGTGNSPVLFYPNINAPQMIIYCVLNKSLTTLRSLSDVLNAFSSVNSAIKTLQFFFFSSDFNTADCSTILTQIQGLNCDSSCIAWLNCQETQIPVDALLSALILDLALKSGGDLPGQNRHVILSTAKDYPLFPILIGAHSNNGLHLSQSDLSNYFHITSNVDGEDDSLQIACTSTQALLSFGSDNPSVISCDKLKGEDGYFKVLNISTISGANGVEAGVIYSANSMSIGIESVEDGPSFAYSIVKEEELSTGSKLPSSSILTFPLMKSVSGWKFDESHPKLSLYINPFKPTPTSSDPTLQSYIEIDFSINAPSIESSFRTVHGDFITMQPVYAPVPRHKQLSGSVKFAFNTALDGYSSLMPIGEYTMHIEGKESSRLLCGLSGTESIEFYNDDIMSFHPTGLAGVYASAEVGSEGGVRDASFAFAKKTDLPYLTAHVMIRKGKGTPSSNRLYYSEGDKAPFFQADLGSDLKYQGLSRVTLPSDPDSSKMFPMVPYYALHQDSEHNNFGFYDVYINTFEFQLLNPTRQNYIEKMKASYSGGGSETVYALTPQGYQAKFINGIWTGITLANATVLGEKSGEEILVSNVDIGFYSDGDTTPLPDVLQKAFLTNQQFLVISADMMGKGGKRNLANFKPKVEMSEWSFNLEMPKSTTPGEYTNVLLFKSGNTTIKQMVKNPHLWTQYEAFNDITSDKNGYFLSNWLVEYLKEAEALYDNGDGVTTLKDFCTLINDKEWNGFLALKVAVGNIATLPVDVQALLANINGGLYAHHLGNEINHVKRQSFESIPKGALVSTASGSFVDNTTVLSNTDSTIIFSSKPIKEVDVGTSVIFKTTDQQSVLILKNALLSSEDSITSSDVVFSYELNSPFFGLIHYVNPKFAGEIKNPPAYVQSTSEYNFTVLTLEVVFQKVLEVHFANKSMLMMNSFFGDKVLQTGPRGEQGANNLILVGTYHEIDKVPSYSFSTAKGVTTDFYLASKAFKMNRISNTTMNVIKLSGDSIATDIYKASFAIRGSFDFLMGENFDLLSYEYLPYSVLSMDVQIQHGKANIYTMDSSKLQFEKNQIKAYPAGSGQQVAKALNIVRTGSLVSQFPMKLKGLIQSVGSASANASPADMGYRLLETATPKGISFSSPAQGVPWYGLEFELILGGKGSLASSGAISASMILTWTPKGSGIAQASPQFKLSGPDGVSLSFDFEGVLKFGAKDIVLNRYIDPSDATKNYFYLVFQSIALSLLNISFPPSGTTNLVLMGDTSADSGGMVKPTLSWFGGYAKEGS